MANGIVLNIDTTKSEFQNPMVQLRQGDGNYQSLAVTVTSNGEPLDLTGWTTTFMGTTAGGFKIIDGSVTVSNALQGEFTYTPTKAWGQDQGEFKNAYFKFTKADETASGASFRVNVLDAVDLTAEEAGNYISVVDVMIDKIKTDMDNKLADTQKTLSDTQSQATTVSSNVTTLGNRVDDYNNKLAAISVGGRNLLLNSTDYNNSNWVSVNKTADQHAGTYVLSNNTDSAIFSYNNSSLSTSGLLNTTDKYIISFLVNNTGNTDVSLIFFGGSTNQNNTTVATIHKQSGWIKVSKIIDFWTIGGNPVMGVSVQGTDGTSPVLSSCFKFEQGTLPTDCTPAPEDVPSNDAQLVHNTGTETVAGNKTFTGITTFTQPINGTIKGITTPYEYGAVGDGVADDTTAIQNMLNDWRNKLCVLKGDFKITKSLLVNNETRIVFSGKIILSSAVDYLFHSNANFGIDGGGTGQIILNYNGGAFTVGGNSIFTPQGVRILGVNDNTIGINVKKNSTNGDTNGYVHLNDVTIVNDKATTGSIGIYGGRDSNYNHLETINIETGVKLYAWDNFIDGYHPWNDIPSVVNKGVGIYLESNANDTHVSNYYNDTMKYGFILDADVTLTIDNALTMWNTEFYNDTNGSGNPFFIYWSNDQLQNVGKMITVSNSPMDQKAGSSATILPYFSSLPNNYILIHNAGSVINWCNLPINQSILGNKTFSGNVTFTKPINGFIARNNILNNDNLNNYTYTGDFIFNGPSNISNYPSGGANMYGYLHVEYINSTTAIQTILTVDLTTYIRSLGGTNPVWTAWKKIVPQSL